MTKSSLIRNALRTFLILGFFSAFTPWLRAQNGIFADFNTTEGNFTIQLDFTNAPMTVANFIGLATGEQSWMNWNSGQVKTNPFYNGLTFHRVVSNFVIQAGSPNGLGTDGPGYVIKDEISPILTHNRTGAVAMAKSEWPYDVWSAVQIFTLLPHTGSSQFYITTATNTGTAGLNGHYSVFGQVVSNLSVVLAIGKVATDTNSKPVIPVVINSVSIRRVGTAAQNFNIQTNPLPKILSVPLSLTKTNQQVTLKLKNNYLVAEHRLFESSDLALWYPTELGLDLAPPLLTNIVRSATNHAEYFAITRVQYPDSSWAPRDLYGRTLLMRFDDGSPALSTKFDQNGGGTWTNSVGGSGSLYSYAWTQDIYRGYLEPLDAANTFWVHLEFTSPTTGVFGGFVYLGIWWPTYGRFTLTPNP